MEYEDFIKDKEKIFDGSGFDASADGYGLFDFQKYIVEQSMLRGRSAIFADCGLGKTPMQLVWADKVREKYGNVLILTPLAVGQQTVNQSKKFNIDDVIRTQDGTPQSITVTNYERLAKYNPADFSGIVCDESSILKNYTGKTREAITEFCQTIPYRLLCTATPAPNDYMELGTSCEALGIMKRVEMLSVYFTHDSGNTQSWILKGHAEKAFWEFMTTWSTAIRKPSDIGFEDNNFILPELNQIQHTVGSKVRDGRLFVVEAKTLDDQRKERKSTINARCDKVAEIANANNEPFICWCSFNDESKMLASKINGSVEITGSDKDEEKEKKMLGFSDGSIRCIVTKPSIAGFGMNWQHCNQMSFFPSHSHEQYYQAIRRCWRFGQKKDVDVHIVASEAESTVLENMKRKERQANNMFDKIIKHMGQSKKRKQTIFNKEMEIPEWLNAKI